jgi:SAM-dependent methyltransferase
VNDGRLSDAEASALPIHEYLRLTARPSPVETREPQYRQCFEAPPVTLGPMTGETWRRNPEKLPMMLARYHYVAGRLRGKARVAEIGCGDAFGSSTVGNAVAHLDLYDFDPVWRDIALTRPHCGPFRAHDICEGMLPAIHSYGPYDAIYALDVLEHIEPCEEPRALRNIRDSLTEHGVFIAGCPSLESQAYASEISKAGHVNCRTGADLQRAMSRWFENVFADSLNEQSLRVGHDPMTRYQLVVCCGPKR